jgi:GntR family transcriptional regulator/MocR family aminotransferase
MDFQIPFQSFAHQHKVKHLALYHALKHVIVAGQLTYGMKLPSSRELAALYLLSRGTVNQVYEMLAAEGYVTSVVGSGTYTAFQPQDKEKDASQRAALRLSRFGEALQSQNLRVKESISDIAVSFVIGKPDFKHFPHEIWSRVMYSEVREMMVSLQKEAFVTQGHLPLREAIARYLLRARGIQTQVEDIIVLNGSMQAIALISQLLVNPGESVVMERPGFAGFRSAIKAAGGKVIEAEVDQAGMKLADWEARLLFVTPSRQFPTGAVLSLERRQALLQWAARQGAIIVEDDYDSEFRHHGRPIEPLKVLDAQGRVVYIGTFSKTMHPDLRLGYAVVPSGLRDAFLKAKQLFEPHPTGILEQRALASFMNSGQYERHLRRMKRIYSRRYDCMFTEMTRMLGDLFEFIPSDAGLHMFAWWKGSHEKWSRFKAACRDAGINWSDGDPNYAEHKQRPSACFGFSHLEEPEMRKGIDMMRNIANSIMPELE